MLAHHAVLSSSDEHTVMLHHPTALLAGSAVEEYDLMHLTDCRRQLLRPSCAQGHPSGPAQVRV